MKLIMKRSILLAAAVAAAWSGSVLAQSGSKVIKLSDAELDAITAGGAQVVIVNAGRANVLNLNASGGGVCVNCEAVSEFLPHRGPAFGVVTIENRGRGVFFQIIGKPHFPQ